MRACKPCAQETARGCLPRGPCGLRAPRLPVEALRWAQPVADAALLLVPRLVDVAKVGLSAGGETRGAG